MYIFLIYGFVDVIMKCGVGFAAQGIKKGKSQKINCPLFGAVVGLVFVK